MPTLPADAHSCPADSPGEMMYFLGGHLDRRMEEGESDIVH